MKTHLLNITLVFSLLHSVNLFAQCEADIKTDPTDPVNNQFLPMINDWRPLNGPHQVNSFLNTGINWYLPATIPINISQLWVHPYGSNTINMPMNNPFSDASSLLSTAHLRTPTNYSLRDYRWEDGWELLWSNLGRFPNGDLLHAPSTGTYYENNEISQSPSPAHAPYFVLYNRYRGTLRLFSNVWFDPLNPFYQDLEVRMQYTEESWDMQNISALFRHNGDYDIPLDRPTESVRFFSPRKHPPANHNDWQVSEFQMAFDPCICLKEFDGNKNPGTVEFEFRPINTMSIDMVSRTVEVQEELTEGNYQDLDFLSMSDIDSDEYRPGTRVYKKMDNLFDEYQERLEDYKQKLSNYYDPLNQAKIALMGLGKNFVSGAGALYTPTTLTDSILINLGLDPKTQGKDASKIVSDGFKGLIGIGYDYAMFELFGKPAEKPTKPTAPVANFSETAYRGTIDASPATIHTPPLLLPGGLHPANGLNNNGYGYGRDGKGIYASNFPAYNKVLGQVALVESPSMDFSVEANAYYDFLGSSINPDENICEFHYDIANYFELSLRFNEELKIAMNNALDFDFHKTKTYANIEVELYVNNPRHLLAFKVINEGTYPTASQAALPENEIRAQYINNLYFSNVFKEGEEGLNMVLNSQWVNFEMLNQTSFIFNSDIKVDYIHKTELLDYPGPFAKCGNISANHTYFLGLLHREIGVKSIKLKLLHDMYFDQIGSYDEQVNTTQVYTYLLYENKEGDEYYGPNVQQLSSSASLKKYRPGTLYINDEHIDPNHSYVFETSGTTIYINAEEVNITGELTVEDGYELIVQSLYPINILEDGKVGKNITLRIKKDWFDLEPFTYMDNSEVYNFCNDNSKYKANSMPEPLKERLQKEIAERELEEMLRKERNPEIDLYPNPTMNQVTVSKLDGNAHILRVYDAKGITVLSKDVQGLENITLDLSSLNGGVYVVTVERKNGTVSRKRLVKM